MPWSCKISMEKGSPGIGPSKIIQISRSRGLLSWFWHDSFLLQTSPFRFPPLYLLCAELLFISNESYCPYFLLH
ncbi:hypothetical protein NC652_008089 [Populus alba x Populus x berolinensis]|nr:hypothetical protein NC652_008089 [Populus alba x Populus x berolinensis]